MKPGALLILLFLIGNTEPKNNPEIRFEGLKIWVTDLKKAETFYSSILGFEMQSVTAASAQLNTKSFPIHLALASQKNMTDYESHERTGLTIQVNKLLPAIDLLRQKGVEVLEDQLQRNGVGISIPFRDPFGNMLSLMEVQIRPVPAFENFKIYNTGITSSDMDKAISFYEQKLGFEEWSRDYLPQAMPLKHSDGSFAFMLHYKPNLRSRERELGKDSEINLLFSTSDLPAVVKVLQSKGISIIKHDGITAFKDPFGNICELIEK